MTTTKTLADAVAQTQPFADQARNQIRKCVNRNRVGRHFFVSIRWRYTDDPQGTHPNTLPVDKLLRIGKGKNGESFVGDFLSPWDTADIREVCIRPGDNQRQPMVRILFTIRRDGTVTL